LKWARPSKRLKSFFQYFNYSKLGKYESCNSCYLKHSNLCIPEDKFKCSNFPFGKKFKFPTEFEFKIRNENIFEISLNFKGVQTFEEKFQKPTKNLS
jgi:hypothetical protein